MPKSKNYSRALRRLAEDLVGSMTEGIDVPDSKREDLATSLVRQWVTYDGQASLFIGEQQVSFVLGKTPLGNPRAVPVPGLSGWLKILARDWKIDSASWPDIAEQLNRGQSAE